MSDPLKNPDRDDQHHRRRDLGEEEDDPDGRAIAEKLYGGLTGTDTDDQDHAE